MMRLEFFFGAKADAEDWPPGGSLKALYDWPTWNAHRLLSQAGDVGQRRARCIQNLAQWPIEIDEAYAGMGAASTTFKFQWQALTDVANAIVKEPGPGLGPEQDTCWFGLGFGKSEAEAEAAEVKNYSLVSSSFSSSPNLRFGAFWYKQVVFAGWLKW